MPSGYTASIKDGITFQQFALRCARAMGALVLMRDEPFDAPIPERFEPSDYHLKRAEEARQDLARLRALSLDEAEKENEAAYLAELARRAKHLQENEDLRAKYQAMLDQVNAWEPPTPDHTGFAEFMSTQINESIKWDCMDCIDEPQRVDGEQWLAAQIEKAGRSIAYHDREHAAEVERTEKRNAWIKALRGSLQ
ncbi:hypothetical protein [Cupriavidus sp. UYPR2.512]|uniref:hypothetical protein n=1 Tax=Cupriavidus sp. UYPR2.512 TaxID=1080187 RepID=UPI0003696342|nr:hypothetical protein [Cupriavidus sp. UYPR2.512]UIF90911.1 hypothetical protein KAF44_32515 [Cupriavidus necator]